MKKKIFVIIPIIIVAIIIFLIVPKHNGIEEIPVETLTITPTEISIPKEIIEPEVEAEPVEKVEEDKENTKIENNKKEVVTEDTEVAKNPETSTESEESNSGTNSTHTDVELTEDEYQGDSTIDNASSELSPAEQDAVDDIVEQIMAEHPEWFNDTGNNASAGNYEHVGTPDTGVVDNPDYQVGESGDEGLTPGGTIY